MINTKQLKEVNLKFNNSSWNPESHDIILKYDAKSKIGFSVNIVPVYVEPKIEDLSLANNILKKFTK
jgi:hypothetical protein